MNLDSGKFDWNEMFSSITRAQLYNTIFWFPQNGGGFLLTRGFFKTANQEIFRQIFENIA